MMNKLLRFIDLPASTTKVSLIPPPPSRLRIRVLVKRPIGCEETDAIAWEALKPIKSSVITSKDAMFMNGFRDNLTATGWPACIQVRVAGPAELKLTRAPW